MNEEELLKEYEESPRLREYLAALCLVDTRVKNFYNLRGEEEKETTFITNRIKSGKSAINKLREKQKEQKPEDMTLEAIFENEKDIAGERIVVLFKKQIDVIENAIKHFPGMSVIKKKDYIGSPKENGYKSLHLVVSVEIYTEEGTKLVPVEIQIRTIAMHAWACLEHYIYKKKGAFPEEFRSMFKQLAKFADKFDELGDKIYELINQKAADAE